MKSFKQLKKEEARRRMESLKKAKESPEAALEEQKKNSLFGGKASEWKIDWEKVFRNTP